MPEIVGQHGVWQQDCDRAVQGASCGGMSWVQERLEEVMSLLLSAVLERRQLSNI